MKRLFLFFFVIASSSLWGAEDNKQLDNMVARSATQFASGYNRRYICKCVVTKEIKSGASYQSFLASSNLWACASFNQNDRMNYFDNPNHMGSFFPLDALVTDMIIPETDNVLSQRSMFSKSQNTDLSSFFVNYSVEFDELVLLRKRALEIFGPLSKKYVSSYSYRDKGVCSYGGKVIEFRSKNSFSGGNKINCPSGEIYFDSQNRVRKVYVENMEDRYSSYIMYDSSQRMTSVADYDFTVEYIWVEEKCMTSYVEQNVRWSKPSEVHQEIYFTPETAPYRNPFKYNISTTQKMFFSNFKDLSNDSEIFEDDDLVTMGFVNDSNYSYWEKELNGKVPFDLIKSQLERTGRSIRQQNEEYISQWAEDEYKTALKNGFPVESKKDFINKLKKKNIEARDIFSLIYSKQYYDL